MKIKLIFLALDLFFYFLVSILERSDFSV